MKMTGIRTVAVAFALFTCVGTVLADLSDGLVVKYSFDSLGTDGQLADESGNGHALTLGSGLSLTNGPLPGMKAIRFDGTSASWAKYDGFALTNRTVSFWMRLDAKNSSEVNNYPYVLDGLGTLNIYSAGGKESTSSKGSYTICNTSQSAVFSFARQRWYHHTITVSFKDNNCQVGSTYILKHYIDGQLSYTSEETTCTGRGDRISDVIIGNNDEGGGRAILGSMADFCVWTRKFSDDEVTALYVDAATPSSPTLVAYWPLDEINEAGGVRTTPNVAETDFTTFPDLTVEGESFVATNGLFDGAIKAGNTACGRMQAANDLADGLSDWSLSFWIKTPYTYIYNNPQRFVETINSARMLTFTGKSSGYLDMRWYLGYGRGGSPYWNMPDSLFGVDAWTHIVMVSSFGSSGTNMLANFKLYSNGREVPSTFNNADSSEIPNRVDYIFWRNAAGLRIGGRHATSPDTNDAIIDEVALFSGALSENQVNSLYEGSPRVDAGGDFSTTSSVARLDGCTVRHDGGVTVAEPGTYAWRLVSAPAGGEGVSFPSGNAGLSTTVTLPVIGVYEFELYSVDSLLPRRDTVTITRVASVGANTPPVATLVSSASVTLPAPFVLSPTVTDSDGDATVLHWSKVSGPGGVWFDRLSGDVTRLTFGAAGTYVVRLTASDGSDETTADCIVTVSAAEQDMDRDLIHYWGLNMNVYSAVAVKDEVTGTAVKANVVSAPEKTIGAGVIGYAFQPNFSDTAICWETNTDLDETPTIADKANSRPTNEYVTVSAWVYVRLGDTNNVAGGIVVGQNQSWDIEYSHPNNPNAFSLMQQGDKKAYSEGEYTYGSIGYSILHFPVPSTPFTGRWTHIAAIFDRWGKDCNAFYIDGTKVTHSSFENLEKCAGRPNNGKLWIGGRPSSSSTGYNGNYLDGENNPLSRCFPGIIDEVKIWKRKLSDGEIAYLAANPAPQNREPQIDAIGTPARTVRTRTAHVLSVPAAYDDGLPSGSSLSTGWVVVSGDSSDVTITGNSVVFDQEGEYVLRYFATDGVCTSYSEPFHVRAVSGGAIMIIR